MTSKPFCLRARLRSFTHAFAGLATLFKTQHNARIHLFATAAVVAAGLALGLSTFEWCWVVLAVMAVVTAEALNTAVEFLADLVSPDYHPLVKKAKDVAAAAVLVSALGAAVIGLLVLGPHVAALFR